MIMLKNYDIPQPPVDGPQYPYRITDDMSPAEVQKVRDAIAVVMEKTHDMLVSVAMRCFRNMRRHELDDIISDMVLHALRYSLPGYDTSQGTKVSTYLYAGYTYGAMEAYKNRKKRYAKNAKVTAAGIDKEWYNTSYNDTDYVYGIAEELVNHPEKYFGKVTAKYIRDLHGDTVKRSSKDYGDSQKIRNARRRAIQAISDMSIEPGEDLTKYHRKKSRQKIEVDLTPHQRRHKRKLEALKMLEMHNSGMTYREIAAAKDLSEYTVGDIIRKIRKDQTNSKSPTP